MQYQKNVKKWTIDWNQTSRQKHLIITTWYLRKVIWEKYIWKAIKSEVILQSLKIVPQCKNRMQQDQNRMKTKWRQFSCGSYFDFLFCEYSYFAFLMLAMGM